MAEGKIIVEPFGGLGNRMRALDSAIAVARACASELHVRWLLNDQLNCRFVDLFEVPSVIKALRDVDCLRFGKRFQYYIGSAVMRLRFRYYGDSDVFFLKKQGYNFAENMPAVVVYKTCRSFFLNPKPYLFLVPIWPLQRQIESYRRDRQIGVHLRRADNETAIKYSPTERFVQLMRKEIELNNKVNFFVSTDAPGEEIRLREEFPGRVLAHAKRSLERSLPSAAQDALIDLYALANCCKIIGSYWSSFSDVAAEIHGIEKIVVRGL